MTLFEYSTALFAIVIGLGIARLLASVADMIKYRDRIQFSAPAIVWHANLLLVHTGWWMVIWESPQGWAESVSMIMLAYTLFVTAILYTAAHLMALRVPESGPVRLSQHYEAVRRPTMVALVLFFALPVGAFMTLTDVTLSPGVLIVVVLLMLSAAVGARVEKQAIQTALGVGFGLLYIVLSALVHPVMSAIRMGPS